MTNLEAVATIIVSVQILGTSWLHYQTNRNACGGKKCAEQFNRLITQSRTQIIGGQEDEHQPLR